MTKRRRIVIAAAAVLTLLILLRLTVFSADSRSGPTHASGTVEATEADLGFLIPGRIEHIAVREGDATDSSTELAWLDGAEILARRDAASAQVAAARAILAELQSGFRAEEVAQGRAGLRAAEHRLNNIRRDYERTKRLHDGGAVSRQALDHQETSLELATAEYEGALEQLSILETGPRQERIAAQRAVVAQAEASLAQVDAVMDNTFIRSPFSGTISARHREPGETVPAGVPVVTLVNLEDRWVRIYVREDQVGSVQIDQAARITADTYPDRVYQGRVTFIADEAEFTPRNVQTTAERVKLVYRVKIQITGDPSHDLKPGIAADVQLDTGGPSS
jgi:HlyD family secretion protein